MINQKPVECQIVYVESNTIWGKWRKVFPPPCNNRNDEIVTGEMQGEKIDMIVFPAQQISELRNISLESLAAFLKNRMGMIDMREITINGAQWYVFQTESSN